MLESTDNFDWLVKIKTIHDLWLCEILIVYFKICFRPYLDLMLSSLIPFVVVLSSDDSLSCLTLKSPIMIVRNGLLCVETSRIGTKLLRKFSNSS